MTHRISFGLVATTLALLMFAASAPSPLYVVYQAKWHFSAITLTSVFAVYALALLVALMVAGSLSDQIGRRPVIAVSLAGEIVAMGLFAAADGVGWLLVARVLQGAATGLATGAVSAALIDLEPPGRAGLAALVNSVAPTVGLAAGALGAGALVQFAPAPTRLVYLVLLGAFVIALAATAGMPETAPRRGGAGITLRPRVAVPPEVRGPFVAVAPGLVAVWALGGLYLSLGPSLAAGLLHSTSHLVGGLVVATLMLPGAVASIAMRTWPARRAMVAGCSALVLGMAMTLASVGVGSSPLFFVGTAVAGLGFGGTFLGAFRWLAGLARANDRAALIASIYVVAYLAFSLPTIAAGVALEQVGLRTTTYVYGVLVAVFAASATAAMAIRPSRHVPIDPPLHPPCPATVPAQDCPG